MLRSILPLRLWPLRLAAWMLLLTSGACAAAACSHPPHAPTTAAPPGATAPAPRDTSRPDAAQPDAAGHDAKGRSARVQPLATGYDQLRRRYRSFERLPADTLRRVLARRDTAGSGAPALEIDGLVVDETLTKPGRDFYDVFYSRWQAPAGAAGYTVRVQERPLPSLGTLVTVRVNDEVAFQARLEPRYEAIEAAARRAAYFTRQAAQQQPAVRIY